MNSPGETQWQRMQAMLEETSDFVGTITAQGLVVYLNRAGRQMVGLDATCDVAERHMSELYPEHYHTLLQSVVLPSAAHDGLWEGEMLLRHLQDGQEMTVSMVIVAHKDPHGTVTHYSMMARNVTAQKQAATVARNAARMTAIGHVGSSLIHELNQPLSAIRGYAQVVLAEMDARDPHVVDLERIVAQSRRIEKIIQQLRIVSQVSPQRMASIEIHQPLKDALETLAVPLCNHRVAIHKAFAPRTLMVVANAPQLQQVFMHLLTNAYEVLDGVADATLSLTTHATADAVTIEFANNGPPLADEVLSHMCDPFFTTKDVQQGIGLGLSLCHGIVHGCRGTMMAENTAEGGVVFRVSLPRATRKELCDVGSTPVGR